MILEKKNYGYPDMVTLSFKVTPFYSLLFAVQRIVSALVPTVTIFITAHFINTAMAILNKTADTSAIYVPIILLATVMVYNVLILVLMNFVVYCINAGETVAIVGENGAGKTTLVRLIMGLYKPSEGKIKLNGMDTSQINSKSLFKSVSGVFQKYQRYQMTLQENMRISDLSNNSEVNDIAEQAGVDVNGDSFPDGYSTMLSREFDGVDLSGGQWQRISIARGLYRVHNTVVLDEPTAAIDPIEESRIYRKFTEISKGKTAIIVTHRLGSVKIADRVIVMDKGKIVAVETHDELMRKCDLYRNMFNSQAEWYSHKPVSVNHESFINAG